MLHNEDERSTVLHVALRLLARREHSYQELKVKLLYKKFALASVLSVLDHLVTKGWLSDQRFAQAYVRARSDRGYGPVRIAQELQQRGVAEPLIEAALAAHAQEWLDLARRVWRKKFSHRPTTAAEWQRQAYFLRYRGFTSEQIKFCLAENDSHS